VEVEVRLSRIGGDCSPRALTDLVRPSSQELRIATEYAAQHRIIYVTSIKQVMYLIGNSI
jgi:hypothetical protein